MLHICRSAANALSVLTHHKHSRPCKALLLICIPALKGKRPRYCSLVGFCTNCSNPQQWSPDPKNTNILIQVGHPASGRAAPIAGAQSLDKELIPIQLSGFWAERVEKQPRLSYILNSIAFNLRDSRNRTLRAVGNIAKTPHKSRRRENPLCPSHWPLNQGFQLLCLNIFIGDGNHLCHCTSATSSLGTLSRWFLESCSFSLLLKLHQWLPVQYPCIAGAGADEETTNPYKHAAPYAIIAHGLCLLFTTCATGGELSQSSWFHYDISRAHQEKWSEATKEHNKELPHCLKPQVLMVLLVYCTPPG